MSSEPGPETLGVHLRRTDENVDEIDALIDQQGGAVGVAGVLESLNRQATMTRVPGRAVEWGFRWDDADHATERWWPQGITTSADATDTEDFEGRRLLVTSWYSKELEGKNHGSRITFVDLETLRYRHVLLVLPEEGRAGEVVLRPLLVHAGGLVWYGPYLHVAGTRRGMFTCRMDDIVKVRSTESTFGYRYVLPVRFSYDAKAEKGVEKMRYSFLSLDRGASPPELVAGEYGLDDQTKRLVRYPLDPETTHLDADEHGTSRPAWYDERGLGHMQGAAVAHGTYYVTVSRGRLRLGTTYVGKPGSFVAHRWTLPPGPEDISYWPSLDMFWCQTEYPGRRFVFGMRRTSFG